MEPVTVTEGPLITAALANMSLGGLPEEAAACETVNVWPAMVSVPLRELVLVFEATE